MGVVTQSSQVLSIQESALGTLSALSSEYIKYPNMSWRVLFMHEMPVALALALPRAGRSRLARIAIMAITTSSSMSVNATRKSGRRLTLSDGMQEFIGSFAFQVVASNGCLLETGYSWYRHTLERTGNRSSQKSAPTTFNHTQKRACECQIRRHHAPSSLDRPWSNQHHWLPRPSSNVCDA